MISQHYNFTFTTERLGDIAYTDKEVYIENETGFRGVLQPLEVTLSQDLDGSYGKDFLLITCLNYDIKIKDRIIDEETDDSYIVVGVRKNMFTGRNDHLEILLRKCDV